MVAPAIIAAGIAAGGSLLGGLLGNKSKRKEAQKNREFQLYMSNTAYQRSMADMKDAGLNPMLAYQQGGATTGSGSMANQEDVISPAINSAMQAYQMDQELKNAEALEKKTKSEKDLLDEQRDLTNYDKTKRIHEIKLLKEQAYSARQSADLYNTQIGKTAAEAYSIAADNVLKKLNVDFFNSKAGKDFYKVMRARQMVNPLSNPLETK